MKKVMMKNGQIEKRVVQENTKGEFITYKNKRVYITKKAVLGTSDCSEYVEAGIDLRFLRNRYLKHASGDISDRLKKSFTETEVNE